MNLTNPRFRWLAAAALFVTPVLLGGCAARASYGYRVYDDEYHDYHLYDRNEEVFYSQWVIETRRPRRDFHKLRDDERRGYWKWRHDHDRGHDRDHDRH